MRKIKVNKAEVAQRHVAVSQLMTPKSCLLLAAQPEYIRNNDVHYSFRQDSNFFYMTGFEEPESVFLLLPLEDGSLKRIMFVRKKDRLRETWDGFRFGVEATPELFGMDEVFAIDELEEKLPSLIKDCNKVYYSLYKNHLFDRDFENVLMRVRALRGRSGKGCPEISDSYPLIGELRLKKRPFEIEELKTACKISAQAHIDVMKACKVGSNERTLQGVFLASMMGQGAQRVGYEPIFASGNNATTLHYNFNECELNDGELLLVDAGAEYNYYTGDITRVFPINGKFTEPQKRVYQEVLDLQKKLVESVRPGMTFAHLQEACKKGTVDSLLRLGLLKGNAEELYESQAYMKYLPHGVGHWLGMDVHDAGKMIVAGESRTLEPHMAFTIEPGIYVPEDDEDAPAEYRGIGVRIEDNILVTDTGYENMTEMCPKEIEDIEALMGAH